MSKFTLIAIAAAFAAASLTAPAMAAGKPKASAGKCGAFMYFDTKGKACKDKRA
jgi:hypothetical protein